MTTALVTLYARRNLRIFHGDSVRLKTTRRLFGEIRDLIISVRENQYRIFCAADRQIQIRNGMKQHLVNFCQKKTYAKHITKVMNRFLT